MTTDWRSEVAEGERFRFGANWLDFSERLTEAQIAQAVADLQRLLCIESLEGKSFLDVGCGSGLSSLAALRLGARHVLALDYDRDSVACTERTLAQHASAGASYRVVEDSILRDSLVADHGRFAVVYAWGSLHHTGAMHTAIRNAVALCDESPDSRLALALYRRTPLCWLWRPIKRLYSAGSPGQQATARRLYSGLYDALARLLGKPGDTRAKPGLRREPGHVLRA